MKFYPHILNGHQSKLLQHLSFLKDYSCYLAGGTAAALQLGHRTSLDFDFYYPDKLHVVSFNQMFKNHIPSVSIPNNQPPDTYQLQAYGVNLSIFYYPYKLIKDVVDFPPIKLASLEDISAMKIAAIVQRAKQRDFFDVYYLIIKLGLKNIIKTTLEKYPWYAENSGIIFKSLTYFDEADQDPEISAIKLFDKNINWIKVKKEISKEVEKYLKRERRQP